ncbi:hypothetical protein BG846_03697 [Streptomyces fradiae ATCC 10745 = DSM 40063]|uniref:Uncharacterized protein n=1 Tax=Streptomyces fradiae ATCC 10745 = DSM 40063 TaxID=1319510 RepID=A0A1Y2NT51_STRFR|nr:hypothetical protein BG846_03697 [Streptomyces fradiae ATCC 10745 = DSM 40063]
MARLSKVWQSPSGESAPVRERRTKVSGSISRSTAPTRATSQLPDARLWQASQTAESDEEQAVSTTRLGPARSKRSDSQAAMKFCERPHRAAGPGPAAPAGAGAAGSGRPPGATVPRPRSKP